MPEVEDDDESKMEGNKRWSPDLGGEGTSSSVKTQDSDGGSGDAADSPPPFSDQVLENVLENVLQFLTSRRDRNAASLVCRSWFRAESHTRRELFVGNCYAVSPARAVERFRRARSLVLKGKPRFADFNLVPDWWGACFTPWLVPVARAYPWLERVCLKRMTVSDANLAFLARSCPSLRDLTLVSCDGFGTSGLASVAEHCKQLRVLDLIENDVEEEEDGMSVDWMSKFPARQTCLESLVFESIAWPVNFESLEALVARSPALWRLRVNDQVSIGQLHRLMAQAPQLTDIGTGSFRSAQVGDGPVQGELDVADLRSAFVATKSLVCLSGFRDLAPQYLPAIYPVCHNFTSLNLSYAEINAEQIKPIILQCHKLQNFWVMDTVGDEGLEAVATACKELRVLRVFPFDASEDSEGLVSDIGLVAISEGCPKLRSILYFCQQMTNAAVITMSKNCQDLMVFRLCIMGRHRPDHATGESMDEAFGAIVKNCKKLTRLSISGLLTDKAFEYIGQYGKSVRTLSVAFAGNSDLSLKYVLEGCQNLQKLEIRDSPFGDTGLLSGIHHYYNMRFLWMSSCKLTFRGCKEVAQRLPHLVVEVIRDSENDDSESVEKLYMYRSLSGPRNDAPHFVKIL